ncbi:Cytochrome P [Trema orientale]|uniref:Cytochrome P n=1 Tax=Trema orientale TaxID=63057 RepID=A0A2P5BHN7_TREOI|nr:Cytochrome P [Trema orientale]
MANDMPGHILLPAPNGMSSKLVPRESRESCVMNGYHIPAKTKVLVNAWAVGRDSEYWTEAEKFYPERFTSSSVDFWNEYVCSAGRWVANSGFSPRPPEEVVVGGRPTKPRVAIMGSNSSWVMMGLKVLVCHSANFIIHSFMYSSIVSIFQRYKKKKKNK